MNFSKIISLIYAFVILALVSRVAEAVPKQHDVNDNTWRRRSPSVNETEAAASDRTQRLGNLGNLGLTTGYGNSLGGSYGSYGGVGNYGKPSIDLGGGNYFV